MFAFRKIEANERKSEWNKRSERRIEQLISIEQSTYRKNESNGLINLIADATTVAVNIEKFAVQNNRILNVVVDGHDRRKIDDFFGEISIILARNYDYDFRFITDGALIITIGHVNRFVEKKKHNHQIMSESFVSVRHSVLFDQTNHRVTIDVLHCSRT